jgi:hypothetical protein
LLLFRETESNWAEELEEDVKGECIKYGPVVHISVDRESEVSNLFVFFYLLICLF